MSEHDFDFEQYEEDLAAGKHLVYSQMSNVEMYTNAMVFAGEAYVDLPEGTRCQDPDCYEDHGGQRVKYHLIILDLLISDDDDEPHRIVIPLESKLGQALVCGDVATVAVERITDLAAEMGEEVTWFNSDDESHGETDEKS